MSDQISASVSAVERTVLIFETLSRYDRINLEDLAKACSLPKATLYRFLQTLVKQGYVRRDSDQYSLTLKLFSVGARGLDHMDILSAARPAAEKLARKLGEAVHVGVRHDEDYATYILKIESKYTIRMYSRVGKHIPLYCTAIGKVLLADLNKTNRDKLLCTTKLVPYTSHTITEKKALDVELAQVNECGFARDREEHEEGITCIAAPVRDFSGTVIAALSVSWPVFRFDELSLADYTGLLSATAFDISQVMGFSS